MTCVIFYVDFIISWWTLDGYNNCTQDSLNSESVLNIFSRNNPIVIIIFL